MIGYKPLWIQLAEKGMTKTEFRKKVKISPTTLATMGKNQYIALSIIDRICKEMNCNIEQIIQYIDE